MTDEKELVIRFKNGDENAFKELVEMYYPKIYNFTARMLGSEDDAWDATQEIFIKVYKGLKKFRQESSLYSWIYRIGINHCLNEMKKRKWPTTEIDLDTLPANCDTEKAVNLKSTNSLIHSYLQRLSPQEKIVFLLRHQEGLKLSEIGDLLKLKEGTVKATLFNANKKMAKIIKKRLGYEL